MKFLDNYEPPGRDGKWTRDTNEGHRCFSSGTLFEALKDSFSLQQLLPLFGRLRGLGTGVAFASRRSKLFLILRHFRHLLRIEQLTRIIEYQFKIKQKTIYLLFQFNIFNFFCIYLVRLGELKTHNLLVPFCEKHVNRLFLL